MEEEGRGGGGREGEGKEREEWTGSNPCTHMLLCPTNWRKTLFHKHLNEFVVALLEELEGGSKPLHAVSVFSALSSTELPLQLLQDLHVLVCRPRRQVRGHDKCVGGHYC